MAGLKVWCFVLLLAHASGYVTTGLTGAVGKVGSRRMTCGGVTNMGMHHHSTGEGGGEATVKGLGDAAAPVAVGGMSQQRRGIVKIALATALALPLGASADGATTTAPPPGEIYTDPEGEFQMWVPKGYFKSRRKIKGQFGTIFTSGNLKTAEIVSVQKLSTEKLLMDAGAVPTGDLSTSWEESIGKATTVATLLAAARDNDAKQASGIPSKVEKGSIKVSGRTMRFRMLTEMQTQGAPVRRLTTVRAELLPDRQYIVAWASCVEEDFGGETRQRLDYALETFAPRRKEAENVKI